MKYVFATITLLISTFLLSSVTEQERKIPPRDIGISEILFALGEEKPEHFIENTSPEMIRRGKDLIFKGRTSPPAGGKSNHISKFYKCISCHNTVKEDPDLSKVDPKARLEYAEKMNIPYLQGSTLYGIVNRESWYNDDYIQKYGSLVEKAQSSLKESIQLCAEVCSQGRTLEDWELESILSYLWSIELKKSDLKWDVKDDSIMKNVSEEEQREFIKSKYLLKSPATFSSPPIDKKSGYSKLTGNPMNGKVIYELSCQHCHRNKGESDVVLNNSKATFRWLEKNINSNGILSIYEIIRKGTYSEKGHREYMPHYTLEKMSDQQIEDLRAYIEQKAN